MRKERMDSVSSVPSSSRGFLCVFLETCIYSAWIHFSFVWVYLLSRSDMVAPELYRLYR
jgi:hypothetical protein